MRSRKFRVIDHTLINNAKSKIKFFTVWQQIQVLTRACQAKKDYESQKSERNDKRENKKIVLIRKKDNFYEYEKKIRHVQTHRLKSKSGDIAETKLKNDPQKLYIKYNFIYCLLI